MNRKKKRPTDPQLIVVLRAVGGAYLLYLAWGLREAAFSEGIWFLLAMVLFALAGAALLFFSVRQLYRGDFLYPGQSPDPPDGEDTERKDTQGEDTERDDS